eukprot:CAMPEP_0194156830 /NCGR_PEP_ID=MMETSP0152-20130528/69721_1 /TAXON_ID=1049557 /ORGANISM="Thalassiothrix antarctica, Strain L6-D1" /LENGTH=50 /DNA_ID=CAMNT_0038864793 /DNA_START=97 /DNA_END=246 /DNA_ORIENTATION=-
MGQIKTISTLEEEQQQKEKQQQLKEEEKNKKNEDGFAIFNASLFERKDSN